MNAPGKPPSRSGVGHPVHHGGHGGARHAPEGGHQQRRRTQGGKDGEAAEQDDHDRPHPEGTDGRLPHHLEPALRLR